VLRGRPIDTCVEVTGQNGSGQMVRTKWYTHKWHGQNGTDKMVYGQMAWTKWYGQNGTDKMVAIFGVDYNSSDSIII